MIPILRMMVGLSRLWKLKHILGQCPNWPEEDTIRGVWVGLWAYPSCYPTSHHSRHTTSLAPDLVPRATSSRQNIFYKTCVAVFRLLRERWPWWWCTERALKRKMHCKSPLLMCTVQSTDPGHLILEYICVQWTDLGSCALVRLCRTQPVPQVQPSAIILKISSSFV